MERERLHQLARRTLLFLADRAEQTHDLAASSESNRRLLLLEPWNEEAHYRLIWLLAHSGERTAALQQYERCWQTLADELGVEPGSETVAIYELIRRDEHDKAPGRRPERLTRQDADPVGRFAVGRPGFGQPALSPGAPAERPAHLDRRRLPAHRSGVGATEVDRGFG